MSGGALIPIIVNLFRQQRESYEAEEQKKIAKKKKEAEARDKKEKEFEEGIRREEREKEKKEFEEEIKRKKKKKEKEDNIKKGHNLITNLIDEYYNHYKLLDNNFSSKTKQYFKTERKIDEFVKKDLYNTHKEKTIAIVLKQIYDEHKLFKEYAPNLANQILLNRDMFSGFDNYFLTLKEHFEKHKKEFRKNTLKNKPAFYIWMSETLERAYKKDEVLLGNLEKVIKMSNKKRINLFIPKTIDLLKQEDQKKDIKLQDGNFLTNSYYLDIFATQLPQSHWLNNINLYGLGKIITKHF